MVRICCSLVIALPLFAQTWQDEVEAGRKALLAKNVPEAEARFDAAAAAATDDVGVLTVARVRAGLYRSRGEFDQALAFLTAAVQDRGMSLHHAATLSDIAVLHRALGRRDEAVATLSTAINMRARFGEQDPVAQARDLTALGILYLEQDRPELAGPPLRQALADWERALRDDPEVLTALEALAGIHRNASEYDKAAPLYERALRIREIAFGQTSAELIGALDSLAYVYFGQKNFAGAEPLYERLLSIWENTAGPDHPMVALTLDKYAEFLGARKEYEKAGETVARAADIRARAHVATLYNRARFLLMQAENKQAADLLVKTIAIGEAGGLTDAMMFEPLRVYAKLLRETKRIAEAGKFDARVKAVIMASPARKPPSQ
jgi:tetratricopeptide (TPR) repeat protein